MILLSIVLAVLLWAVISGKLRFKLSMVRSDPCEAIIVTVAFRDDDQARPVVDVLLEERLVACAQSVRIDSRYVWRGELFEHPEILVLLKTRLGVWEATRDRIKELHPYDTPEILMFPTTGGHEQFLRWIEDTTNPASPEQTGPAT